MEDATKTPQKTLVARDGQIIGEYLGKEFRGLKTQGILRPSDHIYKKGQWQLLFKVSKGYFWEQVEKPKYEELFAEEVKRAEGFAGDYLKLANDSTDGAKKAEYKTAVMEYAELGVYLQKMLIHQQDLWAERETRKVEFEERVKQNQKEMLEEDRKDYWKRVKQNKKHDIKVFFDFLKKALAASRKYNDYLDFLHEGDCGYFPCLDWSRTFSEQEFKVLKKVVLSQGDLEAYAEMFWLATSEDELAQRESGQRTQEAEKVLKQFLGLG